MVVRQIQRLQARQQVLELSQLCLSARPAVRQYWRPPVGAFASMTLNVTRRRNSSRSVPQKSNNCLANCISPASSICSSARSRRISACRRTVGLLSRAWINGGHDVIEFELLRQQSLDAESHLARRIAQRFDQIGQDLRPLAPQLPRGVVADGEIFGVQLSDQGRGLLQRSRPASSPRPTSLRPADRPNLPASTSRPDAPRNAQELPQAAMPAA